MIPRENIQLERVAKGTHTIQRLNAIPLASMTMQQLAMPIELGIEQIHSLRELLPIQHMRDPSQVKQAKVAHR